VNAALKIVKFALRALFITMGMAFLFSIAAWFALGWIPMLIEFGFRGAVAWAVSLCLALGIALTFFEQRKAPP
jgi:hypothetical protein